ncbi:MAG: DedA family protein [Thermofilaceae archaeon]|nr:DedA family protein [Thermofilaceae archaeon]MCX8180244.1 DedA family protein [Thermofilaceae archaeon]MDW8004036.1 DedA family protein [Thermofilaceae archaeon]
MSFLESLIDLASSILGRLGVLGLFALSVAELLFAPIPGEVVMTLAGFTARRGLMHLIEAVVAGTLGNLTGAVIQYYIGVSAAKPLILKLGRYFMIKEADLERAEEFFRKRGAVAVFTGRLIPGLRSVISFPAGMARMKAQYFVTATLAGSLPWNALFVYTGFFLGENWRIILAYSELLDAIGLSVILTLTGYLVFKLWRRDR